MDDLNEPPSEPDSRLSVIYARPMAAYNQDTSARIFSDQHAHAIVFDGACRDRIPSRDGAWAAAPRQADDRPESEPRCVDAFGIGTAVLPLPGATAGLHEDKGGSLKTRTPSGGQTRRQRGGTRPVGRLSPSERRCLVAKAADRPEPSERRVPVFGESTSAWASRRPSGFPSCINRSFCRAF
jgi:hypothetical protein